MSPNRDEILQLILSKAPSSLAEAPSVEITAETPVTGNDSPFDSLALVNLLVETEEQIHERYGVGIALTNYLEEMQDPKIGALADYVHSALKAAADS